MLISVKDRMAKNRFLMMQENFDVALGTIPRWGKRINESDRDVLVQLLSDMEFCLAAIEEVEYKDDVADILRFPSEATIA